MYQFLLYFFQSTTMDFNNWNYKLDQIWNDGIISVQIDADRVNPNGNYIATRIIKKRY